jgi:hypothetical protein
MRSVEQKESDNKRERERESERKATVSALYYLPQPITLIEIS